MAFTSSLHFSRSDSKSNKGNKGNKGDKGNTSSLRSSH